MCACSAASVTIVDGLKAAERKEKCPLCRKVSQLLSSLFIISCEASFTLTISKFCFQKILNDPFEIRKLDSENEN
jgi:E3 ubiquitin-protein ligase BAH